MKTFDIGEVYNIGFLDISKINVFSDYFSQEKRRFKIVQLIYQKNLPKIQRPIQMEWTTIIDY